MVSTLSHFSISVKGAKPTKKQKLFLLHSIRCAYQKLYQALPGVRILTDNEPDIFDLCDNRL